MGFVKFYNQITVNDGLEGLINQKINLKNTFMCLFTKNVKLNIKKESNLSLTEGFCFNSRKVNKIQRSGSFDFKETS